MGVNSWDLGFKAPETKMGKTKQEMHCLFKWDGVFVLDKVRCLALVVGGDKTNKKAKLRDKQTIQAGLWPHTSPEPFLGLHSLH